MDDAAIPGELEQSVERLEELSSSIADQVADSGADDLGEEARELQRLLAGIVRRLRTSTNRAASAGLAGRAVDAVLPLAALAAADYEVGRILDVEVDAIALVTEASRAQVASQLEGATPIDPLAAVPVSQSYLSELRSGKKSLPRPAMAEKLDEYFSTGVREIIGQAREQIDALRRQRAARPKGLLSRFQPAEPGVRDNIRRELIQQELTRRPELIALVEQVLALGPGQRRVVVDVAQSLAANTSGEPTTRRRSSGPRAPESHS